MSTGMIVLDIQAAFDTVWHDGLLHKMFEFKFPLPIIKIIQSFLVSRHFVVCVENSKATPGQVVAGVPQGSVLGPILYNIYTADIPQPSNCSSSMFADDTSIFASSANPLTIVHNLQLAANNFADYFYKWKIKVNASKTNAIFFTWKRSSHHLPPDRIRINNVDTPWVNTVKYLGLYLDSKLLYSVHISKAIEKANQYIKLLYPFINRKSLLSIDNKLIIYKAIFSPIMLYGSPIWRVAANCHINKLQIKQNKILKLILNLPYFYFTNKLHEVSSICKIKPRIVQLSDNFFSKLEFSNNDIIKNLSLQ